MINKKINIGIIGLGYLGNFHYQKFHNSSLCTIKWVIDNDTKTYKKIKDKKIKKGKDFHKIVDEVDAVSIITPTKTHYDIAKFFLKNKKHVLLEKPMTENASQANELIKIARKNKIILQIGHLERFNPVMKKLESEIKDPVFIEGHRLSEFNTRSTDINVIFDLMIHDIDIISNIVKTKINKISAFGKKIITSSTDIANVRLEFSGGCIANLTASRISQKNERKIRVFEKNKYWSVDFMNHKINKYSKVLKNKKYIFKKENFSFSKKDSLQSEINNFLNSCNGSENPLVTGTDGKNAIITASKISKILK
ncbi:MAG: Gfo/Idh/MocA family oxidoreductase [Pseudomonadota bacterium]|nr:Gfo/Idh/MocA family oxidoreductase [Pseudomonadota bacterium]|tara:strand:+ start:4049 stop:4975 length:927 start_codon:yes stop_codon:yes gene_type:complete